MDTSAQAEAATPTQLTIVPADTVLRRITRGVFNILNGNNVDMFSCEDSSFGNIEDIIKMEDAIFYPRLTAAYKAVREFSANGGLYFNRKPADDRELHIAVEAWLSTYAMEEMHMGMVMYRDVFERASNLLNNVVMTRYMYYVILTLQGVEKAQGMLHGFLNGQVMNPTGSTVTWSALRDEFISKIFSGSSFGANKLPVGTLTHGVMYLDTNVRNFTRGMEAFAELPIFGRMYETVDADTGTHIMYHATHLRIFPQRMMAMIVDTPVSRRYARMLAYKVNKLLGFSLLVQHYSIQKDSIQNIVGVVSSTLNLRSESSVIDPELARLGKYPIAQTVSIPRGNCTLNKIAPDEQIPPEHERLICLILGYDRDVLSAAAGMDDVKPEGFIEGATHMSQAVWSIVQRALPRINSSVVRLRDNSQSANGFGIISLPDSIVSPEETIAVIDGMIACSTTLGVFSPCQLI